MSSTITDQICLDIKQDKYIMVPVGQNDINSRTITVTVTQDGSNVNLNDYYETTISVKKPDGYIIEDVCTINTDGTASFIVTQQMCTTNGVALANLTLYQVDDDAIAYVAHTMKFYLDIESETNSTITITSTDEFNTLEEAIAKVAIIDTERSIYQGYADRAEAAYNNTLTTKSEVEELKDAVDTEYQGIVGSGGAKEVIEGYVKEIEEEKIDEKLDQMDEDVKTVAGYRDEILGAAKGFTSVTATEFLSTIVAETHSLGDTYFITTALDSSLITSPPFESDVTVTDYPAGMCAYYTANNLWGLCSPGSVSGIKVGDGDIRVGEVDLSEVFVKKGNALTIGETIALGGEDFNNTASGKGSSALGYNTQATAVGASSFGAAATSSSYPDKSFSISETETGYDLKTSLNFGFKNTSSSSTFYTYLPYHFKEYWPTFDLDNFARTTVDSVALDYVAKNEASYPYKYLKTGSTKQDSGVTFHETGDSKGVWATGTSTAPIKFIIGTVKLYAGRVYIFSGIHDETEKQGCSVSLVKDDVTIATITAANNTAYIENTVGGTYQIQINIPTKTRCSLNDGNVSLAVQQTKYYLYFPILIECGYIKHTYAQIGQGKTYSYSVSFDGTTLDPAPIKTISGFSKSVDLIDYDSGSVTFPDLDSSITINKYPEGKGYSLVVNIPSNESSGQYGRYFFNSGCFPTSATFRITISKLVNPIIASGKGSIAGGIGCSSVGTGSLATGHGSYAEGDYSSTFGEGTIAVGSNQFVIGNYNKKTSDLFVIGNGNGRNSRSNAVTISSDGVGNFSGGIITKEFESSMFPTMFKMVSYTTILSDIKSGSSIVVRFYEDEIKQTGYTPIAIIGISLPGTKNFAVTEFNTTTTEASVTIYNKGSGTAGGDMKVKFLYVRNAFIS